MAAPEIDSDDGINIGNVLIHDGQVDGRDVSADGIKLDGITSRTRYMWLGAPHYTNGELEERGVALDATVGEYAVYSFATPNDFDSIGDTYVYYMADTGTGDMVTTYTSRYRAIGQAIDFHGSSDTNNILNISSTDVNRVMLVGINRYLALGDTGYFIVARNAADTSDTNTGDLIVLGVRIEYVAHM